MKVQHLLVALLLLAQSHDSHASPRTVTTIQSNLRGGRVIHKRTSYLDMSRQAQTEAFQTPKHPSVHMHIRQMLEDGKVHEMDLDDLHHLDEYDMPPEILQNIKDFEQSRSEAPTHEYYQSIYAGRQQNDDSHRRPTDSLVKETHHHHKSRQDSLLPTGSDSRYYNQTLYHTLLLAPFEICSDVFDDVWSETSVPVFSMPDWKRQKTANGRIFSAYHGNEGDSILFEHQQFVLRWEDLLAVAGDGIPSSLSEYTSNHDFQADLIVGKVHGESIATTSREEVNGASIAGPMHLALVVSYLQFGNQKNVLIPFARVKDFFDDDDDTLKELDLEVLIESTTWPHRTNSSDAVNASSSSISPLTSDSERIQAFENMETDHIPKMFQMLIQRTFLFSFGYADCLLQEEEEEPEYNLRQCLDDTYSSVIKMETNLRGALENLKEEEEQQQHLGAIANAPLSVRSKEEANASTSFFGTSFCEKASAILGVIMSNS
eukprot:scaffold4844_cov112-Cylindrotheca_fusiformis.AAC.9